MEKKLDLRVIKTHKNLKEAFIELMNKKRFEDITVNELCQNALVRRATFYKHFADKYEFFSFLIHELQEEFEENIPTPLTEEDLIAFYTRIVGHLVDFLIENEKMVRLILTSSMLPTLLTIISDQIILDFTEKLKGYDSNSTLAAPAKMIASFYTGAIMYSIKYWIEQKNRTTKEVFVQHTVDIIKTAPSLF